MGENIVAYGPQAHANQAAPLCALNPIYFKMSGTLSLPRCYSLNDGIGPVGDARLSSPAAMGVHLMGKGLLLWLIGVPIPIILLIALFYH
jgi:hypothetical protein